FGPGRGAVALRRWAVQAWAFLSQHARRYGAVAIAEGPDFAHAHFDPLRIGGVVAAGVLLFFFTSWAGIFWIALLLVLYEALVTAVAAAGHGPTGEPGSRQAPDAAQTGRSSGLPA
ncbi:MAG TPA: hypothetical protein VIJ15_14655, partial [Dermatophilaceae bacterium]